MTPRKTPARRSGPLLTDWQPEDAAFWQSRGRAIARRNLWISIPCLLLAFSVWMVWSVVVARLPAIGFDFSTTQLFWLAALPGLSGAALRIAYSFVVPVVGGRRWTALSTASLLLPALGIGVAVQDPATPFAGFACVALLCGLGGGNFASSMANINYFYPGALKGNALAMNAGLGNLGVSVAQVVAPAAVTLGLFGALGGQAQATVDGQIWLQNAGFVWVPFLAVFALLAWFGMHDIADAKAGLADQLAILTRRHTWIMSFLYTGTFGSFIGFSAGFPLLIETQFAGVDALSFAFLGPLVGALSRSGTGWIADRFGGGRVTFLSLLGMLAAVLGVLAFLPDGGAGGDFRGFFACFMALFFLTGVGNAATFQMIPTIMRQAIPRLRPGLDAPAMLRAAERESGAIIAFTSAVAAGGAFLVPKSFGTAIALTGGPAAALWGFAGFYVLCLGLTWGFYTRRGAATPC